MPMLYPYRYVDNRTRKDFLSRLTFFLIPSPTGHTDQDLSPTLGSRVDVPVVTASWFKGDISDIYLLVRNRIQITLAYKIPGIGRVRLAYRENHLTLEVSHSGVNRKVCSVFSPDAFGQVEGSPGLGHPA